jgi:hypothetical protein
VTIALADLIIEAGGVTILFAISLTLAEEVVEALRRRPKWENECNRHRTECLGTGLQSERGDVWNSSRCNMCYKACMGLEKWPPGVELIDGTWASCIYPNMK